VREHTIANSASDATCDATDQSTWSVTSNVNRIATWDETTLVTDATTDDAVLDATRRGRHAL
jgi:hypothetical protein